MKKVINTARTVFRLTVISSAVYTEFLKRSEENPRSAFSGSLILRLENFEGSNVLSGLRHRLLRRRDDSLLRFELIAES